jgi:peroxiredoxin
MSAAWGKSLTEEIKNYKSKSKIPEHIASEFKRATNELKNSGQVSKAKKLKKVPVFGLKGESFSKFYKNKPVVLKFYRGNWCPYCQLELANYAKFKDQIEAKGYQVIILTPEKASEIKKMKKKHGVPFAIYQDKNNGIAKMFGIAFTLDKKVATMYKGFGIDLAENQGNKNGQLPMPGTYVINKKGEITFAFIDADYSKRLDPVDLLKKL